MNQHLRPLAAHASCVPLRRPETAAFTLIEMSIVLVIIGLIGGGVLVGESLIAAAGTGQRMAAGTILLSDSFCGMVVSYSIARQRQSSRYLIARPRC